MNQKEKKISSACRTSGYAHLEISTSHVSNIILSLRVGYIIRRFQWELVLFKFYEGNKYIKDGILTEQGIIVCLQNINWIKIIIGILSQALQE